MSARPEIALPPLGLFIDGTFTAPGQSTMDIVDPATETVICKVPAATEEQVDSAVKSAHKAFKEPSWKTMDAHARGALLSKLADLIDRDQEVFANLEALNVGKPAKMALWVDASTASKLCRHYAGWPDKLTGSVCPTAGGGLSYTRYEPLGVVACILPFNFPLLGVITKAAPALATGNTVVVKPAEATPLTALHLAKLVNEAGFPPGVFNVVCGYGETTGACLVKHPLVRKVTFTGSTAVGKLIKKVAADTMKRVTLELGGKNPCLVLPDADVETAVKIASGGNYFNQGQICVGISRVFVPDTMYEQFVKLAAERASKRTLGDQWSGADQGPQASKEQLDRVMQ
jgi:retinal dehydrogenase